MTSKTAEFWPFSLETYRRPGVEAACLALQDDHGADVNCVLFCCWAARAGFGVLTDTEVGALNALSADWNTTVVVPLREVRRALKARIGAAPEGPVAALRQAVKDVELEAEWQEQRMLADLLNRAPDAPPSADDARRNLTAYFNRLGLPDDPALWRHADTVVDAAFHDLGAKG